MAAPVSDTQDLPPGPGLARRWWVTAPCTFAGIVLPVALADVVAVWHNRASRPGAALSAVIRQFAPGMGIWSGLALLACLVALIVTRREVTAWPRIGVLTAAPSLVAMGIVGVAAGMPWALIDVPLAILAGIGGFLLIRAGVRRITEHPGTDTLDTGL